MIGKGFNNNLNLLNYYRITCNSRCFAILCDLKLKYGVNFIM